MTINQVLLSLELGQDVLARGWRLGGPFCSGRSGIQISRLERGRREGGKGTLWLEAPPTMVFGAPSYGTVEDTATPVSTW